MNQSIQPLSLRPYMVPATSPSTKARFRAFRRNIISGGMKNPAALQQAMTVIFFLLPLVTARGCFWPLMLTTHGGVCSSGSPVSSQLNIWAGVSKRLYSVSVCSRKFKITTDNLGVCSRKSCIRKFFCTS